MGTSKSSAGPKSDVSTAAPGASDPGKTALPRRFGSARTSIGKFADTGSPDDLKRGLGHYIRTGYSGAKSFTMRMGATASVAGRLYGVLSAVAEDQATEAESPFDATILKGRSSKEVLDALVEAVCPISDGKQDNVHSRDSINDATSQLLERYPDTDLLALTKEQRLFVIKEFIVSDIHLRFCSDIGPTIQEKAPDHNTALERTSEVRDYINSAVSDSFRESVNPEEQFRAERISDLMKEVIEDVFNIFEEFLQ